MASPRAVAIKTASAVHVIEEASTALAKKFGIEIEAMPNVTRFPADFGRATQLEHLGNVLKSIAVASKASKDADFQFEQDFANEAEAPVVEEAPEVVEEDEPAQHKKGKKASKEK